MYVALRELRKKAKDQTGWKKIRATRMCNKDPMHVRSASGDVEIKAIYIFRNVQVKAISINLFFVCETFGALNCFLKLLRYLNPTRTTRMTMTYIYTYMYMYWALSLSLVNTKYDSFTSQPGYSQRCTILRELACVSNSSR